MTALVGRVEAVYVPPDNTVHGALAVVGEIAKSARLPFYATTESALESGAVAAMSLDFQDAGREAADMMLEVLAGARPDTMAIRVPRTPSITVNGDVAETLGLNTDSLVTWPNLRVQ
jgi:putative ABC transport system substrate-binding protein